MYAKCKTRCYYGLREWLPGEVLHVGEGPIPPHFVAVAQGEVAGQRVQRVAPPPGAVKKPDSASDLAQKGDAVALSQLAGEVPASHVHEEVVPGDPVPDDVSDLL